jgi:hypothetical protein
MIYSSVYQFHYNEVKTYFYASLFVLGNVLVPQLCHLIPQGGFIFLPIYFFTLIAAYKYGLSVGLFTAVASPLVNHLLFGMPPLSVLPILLVKSMLLAVFAAYFAKRVGKVTLWAVALSVIGYQLVGMLFEWTFVGSIGVALQDIRLGYPGILIQIFVGYLVLISIKD